MSCIITKTRLKLLNLVYEYNRLTAALIVRLTGLSLKRVQEHLKILTSAGFLVRAPFHSSSGVAGRACYVYALSRKAACELSRVQGVSLSASRSRCIAGIQSGHVLAINEVRICLEQAIEFCGDIDSLLLSPDYQAGDGGSILARKSSNSLMVGDDVMIIPDIVVVLAREYKRALLFFEIDRGTQPQKKLVEAVESYCEYRGINPLSGKHYYERFSQKFSYPFQGFRLLWVGDLNRFRRLFSKLEQRGGNYEFVWATEKEHLTSKNVLSEPVWMVCGKKPDERFSLIERRNSYA